MNGAVSKVNKKFISHLTWAKHTPLAEATVQVSHALPAVRSLVLIAGPISKMVSQQEKAFCKTEHTESLFLLRRHLVN